MIAISVEVAGLKPLVTKIKEYEITFAESKQMRAGAVRAFYMIEEEMFASLGGKSHWKSLSSKYKKWKDLNYSGMPIMQMTGALKNALTGKDKTNIRVIDSGYRTDIILKSAYFANHQYGNTVPKRMTVNFSKKDRDFLLDAMLRAVAGGRLEKIFSKE